MSTSSLGIKHVVVIGAGMIGGTLARRLAELGHDIAIANSRGPETLTALASEVGARAVTAAEAARSGEIVVVTIPQKAVNDLPADLFADVPQRSSSSTPATTIPHAMAAFLPSNRGSRKARGSRTGSAGR